MRQRLLIFNKGSQAALTTRIFLSLRMNSDSKSQRHSVRKSIASTQIDKATESDRDKFSVAPFSINDSFYKLPVFSDVALQYSKSAVDYVAHSTEARPETSETVSWDGKLILRCSVMDEGSKVREVDIICGQVLTKRSISQ